MPTITNDSLYFQQYCTDFTGDNCIQRTYILGMGKEELKQSGVEVLTTCAVFILVLLVLVRLVKGIFRLILPSKGKR